MEKRSKEKSKFIATGGVFLAVSLVAIFIGSFIPGIEMTVYVVASLAIFYYAMEAGPKYAWVLFGGALILGAVLVPNKVAIVPYALVFGLYPVVKCTVENLVAKKKGGHLLCYTVKTVYYAAVATLAITVFKALLLENLNTHGLTVIAVAIIGYVIFLLYDGILTGAGAFLWRRLHRKKDEFDFTLSK